MPSYLTNRGKLLIAQGDWDDAAASDISVGLLQGSSIPTTIDTAAEVADLNFVSDLLALATEATFTNYVRTALVRTASAEDDTNDRVNMDAADVTFTNAGGATNNTLYGGFVFKTGAADTSRPLLSTFYFASTITTNGSNLTLTIADLYRLA